jgi:hypothetical protein
VGRPPGRAAAAGGPRGRRLPGQRPAAGRRRPAAGREDRVRPGRAGPPRPAAQGGRQRPIKPEDLEAEPSIELHEEEGEEDLENAVEHGHGPIDTPGKALEQYTDTISDLLDINTEIAPGSNDEALLKGVAASVALARAKDFADSQRSLMQRVYAAKRFQGAEHTRLSALVAAETIYRAQFEASATEAQHAFFEDMVSGDDVEAVERDLDAALGSSDKLPKLGVDPQDWFDAMTVKLDRMRTFEERLGADVIATGSALQRGAERRAWLYSLLLAAGVVLALVLALVTARSLIRPCAACPGWCSGSRKASRSTCRRSRRRPSRSAPGTRSATWPRRSTPCTGWQSASPAARPPCAAASATCSSTWPGAARA